MLREMGVQVWMPRVPAPAAAAAPAAPPLAAPPPPAPPVRTAAPVAETPAPAAARHTPPAAGPAPAVRPAAVPAAVLRGDWQAMSTPEGEDPQAPVWLLLVDSPTADPGAGDAGKLLAAMLRAAGLHRGARVWAAAVGREGEPGIDLSEGLAQALQAHRPAVVLALGRLSAQAALGRGDPLGRLRGAVHPVDGFPLIASYEPAYLLRAQDDKARAWEDICRALAVVRGERP
ncbi:hypothetical protein GT347_13490 [Xylophilus rhododendri]|uniref:Uracil-DNA glycosylase-like domain-containing protein n=2 Tax=Xylophilus rhododendri TaxID=2697032 RepID=A0A857JD26_9BURK|nr:hypothetical protein GT347_13490 [Xylophilus rhododendri]